MADPAHKLATYADLLALPEGVRGEVIGGELVIVPPTVPTDGGARMMSPSALPRHGRVQAALSAQLAPAYDFGKGGPGGWWILTECDVAVSAHDILTPDLLGYRRTRLPTLPDELPLLTTPDWVCEILSPSTQVRDRTVKAELYHAAGVAWYWIADPQARLLEAWKRRDDAWVRLGAWSGEQLARVAPFEEVELDLGLVFPAPESKPTEP